MTYRLYHARRIQNLYASIVIGKYKKGDDHNLYYILYVYSYYRISPLYLDNLKSWGRGIKRINLL